MIYLYLSMIVSYRLREIWVSDPFVVNIMNKMKCVHYLQKGAQAIQNDNLVLVKIVIEWLYLSVCRSFFKNLNQEET